MATGTTPALNEPPWLQAARGVQTSLNVPDEMVPPPGDGALFVADCLARAGFHAPETVGELAAWGNPINPKFQVPQIGSIVIVSSPNRWIASKPEGQKPATALTHVGFLVRSSTTMAYVLGEGVVRAFPKAAIGGYRWPA